MDDPKLGRLRISLWENLHFRKASGHPMSLLRVERLYERRCGKVAQPLWLAWIGEQMPALSEGWLPGEPRLRRPTYPIVKKSTKKGKQRLKTSA